MLCYQLFTYPAVSSHSAVMAITTYYFSLGVHQIGSTVSKRSPLPSTASFGAITQVSTV